MLGRKGVNCSILHNTLWAHRLAIREPGAVIRYGEPRKIRSACCQHGGPLRQTRYLSVIRNVFSAVSNHPKRERRTTVEGSLTIPGFGQVCEETNLTPLAPQNPRSQSHRLPFPWTLGSGKRCGTTDWNPRSIECQMGRNGQLSQKKISSPHASPAHSPLTHHWPSTATLGS